jgi:tetratricopeptide (TPR) repeat protein
VWQIEQNRAVLKSILEVLMAPIDTQAKERRKRAEEAYVNGWIDDAEEEFLESERLNKFDFSIHISLGMIYLFRKIDKERSLSFFEKAIKYATPKSNYHTSYALLYKALIKFDLGDIQEAETCTAEALNLSPELSEALYQNAQYNAQLRNIGKSMTNLEKAIQMDRNYCLKASNDPLFDPVREHVIKLFERMRQEQAATALNQLNGISTKYDKIVPIISRLSNEHFDDASPFVTEIKQIELQINDLKDRIQRNSYFDFLEANNSIAPRLKKNQDGLAEKLKARIRSIIESSKNAITTIETEHKNRVSDYLDKTGMVLLVGSFVVPAVTTLIIMPGWSKLQSIVFLVPFLSQGVSLIFLAWLIFAYTGIVPKMDAGSLVLAWSVALYLVGSISYFFISRSTSKQEMRQKIAIRDDVLRQASLYAELIKDL